MTATTQPVNTKANKVSLTVFPPRNPEDAQKQGVFVAPSGITYCHFHAVMNKDDGTTQVGRLVAYKDMADSIGRALLEAFKDHKAEMATSKKKDKEFKGLTLIVDTEIQVHPEYTSTGEFIGNHVDFSVYAYRKDGNYITTRGGVLIISEDRDQRPTQTTSVLNFF